MGGDIGGAIIIGAGQAGCRAAKALRDCGYRGPVTLIGAEACLPYERPLLSKDILADARTPTPTMFDADFFSDRDIQLLLERTATAIDRVAHRISLNEGGSLPYEGLIIATGSRVRRLLLPGYPEENLYHLRSIADARALERRLTKNAAIAVVGGGFIGLEVAAAAIRRGCRVAVIESASRLLPRLGSVEASTEVLASHRDAGVEVHLGALITNVEKLHLTLNGDTRIDADLVVAGIGVAAETALAEAAGLTVNDGIVTDECGRTSDPGIFAAGDVTRHFNPALGRHVRLESWQNANLQGDAAARTLAGIPTTDADIPWFWSDQGELNLQIAGLPDRVDFVVTRGTSRKGNGLTIFQFCESRLVGGITINRGREMPLIRRMLEQRLEFARPSTLSDESVNLRNQLKRPAGI